jgi:hypothetical protein
MAYARRVNLRSGRSLALFAMIVAIVSFSTSSPLIKWSESTG